MAWNRSIIGTFFWLTAFLAMVWAATVAFLLWQQDSAARRYEISSDYYITVYEAAERIAKELAIIENSALIAGDTLTLELRQTLSDHFHLIGQGLTEITGAETRFGNGSTGAYRRLLEENENFKTVISKIKPDAKLGNSVLTAAARFRNRAEQYYQLRKSEFLAEREVDRSIHASEQRNALVFLVIALLVGIVAVRYARRGISDIVARSDSAERAVHDSDEQLRLITENLPVLIAYVDRDQRYRFVNRLFETWYQRPVSEILGRRLNEVMLPESYADLKSSIDRALAGEVVLLEDEGLTPDGIKRYRRTHYLPHRREDGEVVGFFGLVYDITDLRRAALELERQGARLAEAQRIGNMGSWERDAGSGALTWSDQVYRIFGIKDQASTALTNGLYFAYVHDEDRAQVQAAMDRALAGGPPYSHEHRIIRSDGEIRFVIEEAEVVRDAAGRPLRMTGTVQDITERKRAEDALRDREEQLRLITDNLPASIVQVGPDRRYRFVNKMATELLARPASEIVGKKASEIVSAETYEALRPLVDAVLAGNRQDFQSTLTYPDGSVRQMEFVYIPQTGPDQMVNGYFGLGMDISRRHALEEHLRQSQKMEAVGQLTGGIAHDFNNLLAVIMGNLELLLERTGSDAGISKLATRALGATQRGADLTHRLLAFSRRQPLRPVSVDISHLVQGMHDLLARTLGEAIEIELVVAAELWRCEVDAGQLESAILNLSINARDAMPQGGKLTIETSNAHLDDAYAAAQEEVEPGQYVLLAVSDTGTGMSAEIIAQAFEPFFTTKEVGKGSGLGLSMIHGFVKQSRGHVRIYSELGEGTTMRLYFPRSTADPVSGHGAVAPAVIDTSALGEVVMVVEDDVDVRTVAVSILDELGYEILEAGTAVAALEQIERSRRLDLLITDVVLPGGLGGRDLADKALALKPSLKVLYMSGYTKNAIMHHGRLDEGVQLLTKPFGRADFALKIRQILDDRA